MTEATPLPTVEAWLRNPADKRHKRQHCPTCGSPLGITPDWLSVTKRDEWTCQYCGFVDPTPQVVNG